MRRLEQNVKVTNKPLSSPVRFRLPNAPLAPSRAGGDAAGRDMAESLS